MWYVCSFQYAVVAFVFQYFLHFTGLPYIGFISWEAVSYADWLFVRDTVSYSGVESLQYVNFTVTSQLPIQNLVFCFVLWTMFQFCLCESFQFSVYRDDAPCLTTPSFLTFKLIPLMDFH